jgi:hypothetical protein
MKNINKGTQADTIMTHLQRKEFITDVEASGLYGIGQLAYVIHTLRKKGYEIISNRKTGVRASYVQYSLVS